MMSILGTQMLINIRQEARNPTADQDSDTLAMQPSVHTTLNFRHVANDSVDDESTFLRILTVDMPNTPSCPA